MGWRGGNRRSGRKPDQGDGGKGGNRNRRATAVGESRKATANRVARHQADHNSSRRNMSTLNSYRQLLLQLLRARYFFLLLVRCCALILREFLYEDLETCFYLSSFALDLSFSERSLVSWVDDGKPVSCVLCRLTHPPRVYPCPPYHTVLSTRRHPAQPVFVPILRPERDTRTSGAGQRYCCIIAVDESTKGRHPSLFLAWGFLPRRFCRAPRFVCFSGKEVTDRVASSCIRNPCRLLRRVLSVGCLVFLVAWKVDSCCCT